MELRQKFLMDAFRFYFFHLSLHDVKKPFGGTRSDAGADKGDDKSMIE